jgi:hypothetical protein
MQAPLPRSARFSGFHKLVAPESSGWGIRSARLGSPLAHVESSGTERTMRTYQIAGLDHAASGNSGVRHTGCIVFTRRGSTYTAGDASPANDVDFGQLVGRIVSWKLDNDWKAFSTSSAKLASGRSPRRRKPKRSSCRIGSETRVAIRSENVSLRLTRITSTAIARSSPRRNVGRA